MSGTSSTFTTLPDGSILSETLAGSSYYYLSDGMGNVAALTDGTGTVVDQYAYDPMGNITSSSGSVANPFTFQGWMCDSANNLYYTGSGYYDPATDQMIGRRDQGWVDPGEDNCGEDEGTSCNGVGQPTSHSSGNHQSAPMLSLMVSRPSFGNPCSKNDARVSRAWVFTTITFHHCTLETLATILHHMAEFGAGASVLLFFPSETGIGAVGLLRSEL